MWRANSWGSNWKHSGGYQTQRPRERIGARQLGTLLEWKGKYGWIGPDYPIDHYEAGKHGGRVYVSCNDLVGVDSWALFEGVRLSFVAYADGNGIGAGDVWLDDEATQQSSWRQPNSKSWWSKGQQQTWSVPKGKGKAKGKAGVIQTNLKTKGKACGKQPQWATPKEDPKELEPEVPPAPTPVEKSAPPPAPSKGKGFKGRGPNRHKDVHSGQCGNITWACCEMQGWRPAMEDAVVAKTELSSPLESYAMFGVFDGHGGAKVSRKAADELPGHVIENALQADAYTSDVAQHALEQAFPAFDAKLREHGDGQIGVLPSAVAGSPIVSDVKNAYGLMGSTAVVALLQCEGSPAYGRPTRVVVANCGDSRAALCRGGQAVPLSEDHKPDDAGEKARIEKAGGFVAAVGPCQRVDGWGLNLSRAFGDFHYKGNDKLPYSEQKVIAVPDMRVEDICEEDEFLFLGCDGVFELHETQTAIDFARRALSEGKPLEQVVSELVDSCCSPDLMSTCGRGGDNVSAMIVLLKPDPVSAAK